MNHASSHSRLSPKARIWVLMEMFGSKIFSPPRRADAGGPSIDLEGRAIIRDGLIKRLEPKAAAVLAALLDAAGRPMKRETLLDRCWMHSKGSDEALTQAIAQLRRALGDDAASPRYIATIPKLGYRWIAPALKPTSSSNSSSHLPKRLPLALAAIAGALGLIWSVTVLNRSASPSQIETRTITRTQKPNGQLIVEETFLRRPLQGADHKSSAN